MQQLIELLRLRLSVTDARDVADDWGRRAGLGGGLYDRLSDGGLDDRIGALVRRAEQVTGGVAMLRAALHTARPDLDTVVRAALADAAPEDTRERTMTMSDPKKDETKPDGGATHNYYGAVFSGSGNQTIGGTGNVFGGQNVRVNNIGTTTAQGSIAAARTKEEFLAALAQFKADVQQADVPDEAKDDALHDLDMAEKEAKKDAPGVCLAQ